MNKRQIKKQNKKEHDKMLRGLRGAFEEVKLIREGRLHKRSWYDFRKEMNKMINEENMKQLVQYLKDNGFEYEDDVDMSTVYFSKRCNDEEWMFSLTEPNKGNKNRWMFRGEKNKNFERWGNTYFEEFYLGVGHFISYAIKELEYEMKRYDEAMSEE